MAEERTQRRLAAILAADVVGYSRLMEQDEADMARLRQLDPQLRLSNLGDVISPLRPDDRAKYVEGLRKAGLPE